MKKNYFLWILILCSAISVANAQSIGPSTLNASGGSATAGGNTYEWSVGEMTLVSTATSASVIVTQGVLQPVQSTNGVGTIDNTMYQYMDVYPVPTSSMLYLQPHFTGGGTLQYSLLDVTGKTIVKEEVTLHTGKEKQSIDLNRLAAANYMLVVHFTGNDGQRTAAYTIQKQ